MVQLDRLSPSCCEAEPLCTNCLAGTTPTSWTVVISGIVNKSPVQCVGCASLNGSYLCTAVWPPTYFYCLTPGLNCYWESGLFSTLCFYSGLGLNYRVRVGIGAITGGIRFCAGIQIDGAGNYFYWYEDKAATDCDLSGDVLTSGTSSSGAGDCDFSGATCTITGNGPFG